MTGPVRLAPLRQTDLELVVAIEQRVQSSPWSAALLDEELRQPNRTYLAAWQGGCLGGYAGSMLVGDEMHVTTIAVDPGARRQRIASTLLAELLSRAVAAGAKAATLEVRAGNIAARRLYAAFGFAPVGVRPGYYGATGEDAIIMWAHDIDRPAFAGRLAGLRGSHHNREVA